jgi:hypothetical protein
MAERIAGRVLVGEPEGERPSGRRKRRWEDNIKIDRKVVRAWTGLISLRIGTSGGLMLTRQ